MLIWFELRQPQYNEDDAEGIIDAKYSSIHQYAVLGLSNRYVQNAMREFDPTPVIEALGPLQYLQTPPKWDNSILKRLKETDEDAQKSIPGDDYCILYPTPPGPSKPLHIS